MWFRNKPGILAFNHLGRLGYLGNQMFQYAAIKGIAAHNGLDYRIPRDGEMQLFDGFRMSRVTRLRGFLGHRFKRDSHGAPVGCRLVSERGFEFDEQLFNHPPLNVSLYGFFQSKRYFAHIDDELKEDFSFKHEIVEPCSEFIEGLGQRTVSVHVRRSDYLAKSKHHFNLPDTWYQQALSMFPNHAVLVFSDDMAWCREQAVFSGDRFFFSQREDGKQVTADGRWGSSSMGHWYDLCLQSLCDDNIISNSTFSWWGAYLNANPDKVVIAPDPATRWFGPASAHLNTRDLIPGSWVRL